MELRMYMGPKYAQIPRGAVVKLVKKAGRVAIVEYEGKRYVCPTRLLWRLRRVDVSRIYSVDAWC